MWYNESIFYQIYPFGFCGAPEQYNGVVENRIVKIKEWIPHFQKIGVNALYLCPVFESDEHGYDTRDYKKIDSRLGSNEDFAEVCLALHKSKIRVVLDGVLNHVGRGFWAFRDVLEKKQASPYKDWFYLDFNRNSNYNDGFWYEGWEGHFNLVKLNLKNPEVVEHLFSCIRGWVEEFDIDGLRLDVAYLLDLDFLRQLRSFCKSIKPDFFLVGEAIHGDYNRIVNSEMLDSCTNYECYKGIFSSFNDKNMFEVAHSLNRQFGSEQWTLYKGMHLFNFVDNHDVSRIASALFEKKNLHAVFGLLFGIPGIPCIYYGSEWGAEGKKESGTDASLRPCFEQAVWNNTAEWIGLLSKIRKDNPALMYGNYKQLYLTNQQFVFLREYQDNKVIVAINCDSQPHTASVPIQNKLKNLISDTAKVYDSGNLTIPPHSAVLYQEI